MTPKEALKIMQGTEAVDESNILEKLTECFENGKVMAFQKGEFEKVIKALETAQKEHERLEKVEQVWNLYRLQQEYKERYTMEVRLKRRKEILDSIREIAEEIYLNEEELEEQK